MISPQHSEYELFLQVFVIDSIPLLVNGKTDRQALLRMYKEQNTGIGGEKITHFRPFYKFSYFACGMEWLLLNLKPHAGILLTGLWTEIDNSRQNSGPEI
jgi:hypothetical protein